MLLLLLILWIFWIHPFLPPLRGNMTGALSRIYFLLVLCMGCRCHPRGTERNGDGQRLLSHVSPLRIFHSYRCASWGRIGRQLRLINRRGRMPHT